MSDLHRRAEAAGLLVDWEDAAGRAQRVSDDNLAAILDALGDTAEPEEAPLVTADLGKPVRLPDGSRRSFDDPGYHELGGVTVAVAPARGWTLADAAPGRRAWGTAVQIPSLRDRRGMAYGDFASLARFAEAAGEAGADALAMSPVHALFPADPSRFSPYGPSSRLFLNVLLADPGGRGSGAAGDLIDWETAIPERMAALRRRFEARSDAERAEVGRFAEAQGEKLERHARHDALHAHFLEREGLWGWKQWPSEYRDPQAPAVETFAAAHREKVEFHLFLQWLAARQLGEAQAAARRAGMAVGLVADLAVGMDPAGSHAWSRPDALLDGLTVGAPPDPLGPDGQDWGLTTFSPAALKRTGFADFIDTIRAALAYAGGVRIDHAMGLRRLWVVPKGGKATDGAYLTYPEADLMRLLALESWRAKAIVIGEDLGTVPDGFREAMAARGFLGMRVLWFERGGNGAFTPPERWDAEAAAMTSTHDLPTVAGWWTGRDVDWTHRIGRTTSFDSEAEERRAREDDKAKLWKAFGRSGPPGDAPEAVTAAIAYVAKSACALAIVPAEDLLGVEEQPNLPGTIDEHPNWRRRLPALAEETLDLPEVKARTGALNRERGR